MKKLEASFKCALRQAQIDPQLPWEEIKSQLDFLDNKEFEAVANEEDRIRIYKVTLIYHIFLLSLFHS